MQDDDEFDEFDGDIPDEDLLQALSDVQQSSTSLPSSANALNATFRAATAPGDDGIDDLPADAFDSSPESNAATRRASTINQNAFSRPNTNLPRLAFGRTSSTTNLRQTTLFGGSVGASSELTTQLATNGRRYVADLPPEEPTTHEIDKEAMKTWSYPINIGSIRDYQFTIVKNSLFQNTLVALPTGLGKTFIAATVMLNFYRWTRKSKIVFVAPTKPLVAQQVDACFHITGIPRSETTLLTGDIQPALRVEEWQTKRIFFMTPQTLLNDLSHGYAKPQDISLLVVDEAHRSVGEYAYAKVAKFLRRFSKSFRVLALTATPGSTVEGVQEVIDNLGIAHVEIRTEDSLDIRQYVHQRNIEQVGLDPSPEIQTIRELFSEALKPLVEKLSSQNIYYARDPMNFTSFGLMKAQQEWFAARGRSVGQPLLNMMRAVFGVLLKIAHSIKLLNIHGIKPFYDNIKEFRNEVEEKGQKGSKYKNQLIKHESFVEMMESIEKWVSDSTFIGHPKLSIMSETILNHCLDTGNDTETRIIVFSEYRDSAEEIVRILNLHQPMVRATVFVGQADSKRTEGMKQAQQIETIDKFRKGTFNVLVATSIGEEGLDIGQVDLIVCYDASSSPIRMLQRMGRTGRKRAGRIVLLLSRGKEEEQYARSKENYEQMQKMICEGSRFNFRYDLSTRIVPRDIKPEVDKCLVEIPIENTQNDSLPEPKRRRATTKKKPAKVFHMPTGDIETGFMKASVLGKPKTSVPNSAPSRPPPPTELDYIADVPPLHAVVLSKQDQGLLKKLYQSIPLHFAEVELTPELDFSKYPNMQRRLRPTGMLGHGRHTKRMVKMYQSMTRIRANKDIDGDYFGDYTKYLDLPVKPFASECVEGDDDDDECSIVEVNGVTGGGSSKRPFDSVVGDEDWMVEPTSPPKRRKSGTVTKKATTRSKPKTTAARKGKPSKRDSLLAVEVEVEGGDDDDDLEEEEEDDDDESLPTHRGPVRSSTKIKSSKRSRKSGKKGKKNGRQGRGINSDEVGDDCMRDSDANDTDGSDDGADLVDFIVSDGHPISSMPSILEDDDDDDLAVATPPSRRSRQTQQKKRHSKTSAPQQVTVLSSDHDEDDDDELPDLGTLINQSSSAVKPTPQKTVMAAKKSRGTKRSLVFDSDD